MVEEHTQENTEQHQDRVVRNMRIGLSISVGTFLIIFLVAGLHAFVGPEIANAKINLVQAVGVIIAGLGLASFYFTWRNLSQARELIKAQPRTTREERNQARERAQKLEEVVKGNLDKRGREILDVFWAKKQYVIFQHSSGISPHFSDDEEVANQQLVRYGEIGPLLTKVYALRSGAIWRGESIDREIARGISRALEDDVETAKLILSEVRDRLRNLRTIRGQLEYQLSSFVVALLVVMCLGVALLLLDNQAVSSLASLRLLEVAGCGALGGFLSVSVGIRKVEIDPDADWRVNSISGASRIVIAIIGSIFVYLAIVSGLILGNLSTGTTDASVYAISIAAGFSETFVPNVLRQITPSDTTQT